jgi:transitional endoplasmic reticulum ATPase
LARKHTPCVLFFDEVDALGANRSDMKNSSGRHLINQFLSEMDGMETNNEGILILAATNAPWHLDPAFRRPGRFDRIIFVQPPDDLARKQILELNLNGKPTKDLQLNDVVTKTNDYSGADIKSLIDVTIEDKLMQSMKTGIPEPIFTKDILSAIKKVVPSTKEWFTIARNYALYSNESGLYDDILSYLKIKK